MAWKLVRRDTHGTQFDVATYESKSEAEGAMASFESGDSLYQTYFVEPQRPFNKADFHRRVEELSIDLGILTVSVDVI